MKTDIDFLKALTLAFCASTLSSGIEIHSEITTVMIVIFAVSFVGAAVGAVWIINVYLKGESK